MASTAATPSSVDNSSSSTSRIELLPLQSLQPELHERAWSSIPHPTLPLIATAHAKSVTVYSLSTLSSHSSLTGGHARSVRSVAWKPGLGANRLCLVTGSFDATAGLWRWDGEEGGELERDMTLTGGAPDGDGSEGGAGSGDWEFTLVLEGHDSEVKSCTFSPSGNYLATCSRDKSVWIWEDIGASEADDEWETISVLNEHEGDVKAVAWCPDVPGRNSVGRRYYSADVLASASYDNTVRIWREDSDAEWVCVAVLEGHEGTVWGLQWEPKPRDGRFPRLLTFSADSSIRVWTLTQEDDNDDDADALASRGGLGGIPNTMRRSLREEWTCTAILPKVHTKDVYSVAWSAESGLVASTGSDGVIALYKETPPHRPAPTNNSRTNSPKNPQQPPQPEEAHPTPATAAWQVVSTVSNGHGPYEINHVTWCWRHDAGSSRRGQEEMLVTTGDDGVVQPWKLEGSAP